MKKYIRARFGALALVILSAVLFSGASLAATLLQQHLIDGVTEKDMYVVGRTALALLGCGALEAGAFVVHNVSINLFSCKLGSDIRVRAFAGILRRSYQDFSSRTTSDYISAMTNDLQQLIAAYIDPMCLSVSVAILMLRSIILMFHYQPVIALLAILFAGLIAVFPIVMGKLVEKYQGRRSEALAALNAQMADAFIGFEVISSFGIQGRINRRFQDCVDTLRRREYKYYATGSLVDGMGQFFSILAQAVILIMAGYAVLQGKMTLGALTVFIGLSSGFCGNFSTILRFLPMLKGAKPLIERINELADYPESSGGRSAENAVFRGPITVENVSFQYEKAFVLENFSARFEKGGKYALTGPSGCGKSTLLRLLMGWLPEYSGTIRFDGRDARELTPEQLQAQISYIEQNVFLFNATLRENITLGADFTDAQLKKALTDSALVGDLENMPDGLDTLAGENGHKLSGGQKQRVAIARALLHNRSVLLIDEGTSALDRENADIVEKSLLANPELTLILVSHHLSPERASQFTQVYTMHAPAEGRDQAQR